MRKAASMRQGVSQTTKMCISIQSNTLKIHNNTALFFTWWHLSCHVNKYSLATSLVGKSCLETCYLQGHKTEVLWDTGSQAWIVDEWWTNKYISEVKLKDIQFQSTEAPDGLQLVAANGISMLYVGWVEITIKLASPVYSKRVSHSCPYLIWSKVIQANHWLQCDEAEWS